MEIEIGGIRYHNHPNGGGWVAETALVDASVYVGPLAVVHGGVELTGELRLEGRMELLQDEAHAEAFKTPSGISGTGSIEALALLDGEEDIFQVAPLSEHHFS